MSSAESFGQEYPKPHRFVRNSKHAIITGYGKYGISSYLDNRMMTSPTRYYDRVLSSYEYSESDNMVIVVELNGRYGLVDEQTGKEILSPEESPITTFTDETIFYFNPLKWTINGKETTLHTPVCHSEISHNPLNDYKIMREAHGVMFSGYENNVMGACGESRIGMISLTGEQLTPIKYTLIKDVYFKKGFSMVEMKEKRGMIDPTGKEIIPCIYDYIQEYDISLTSFVAQRGGKYGVVNISGEEIIPFEYHDIKWLHFLESGKLAPSFFLTTSDDGGMCLYDDYGNLKINKREQLIDYYSPSRTMLCEKKKDKWAIIDYNGKIVMPFVKLDISPSVLIEGDNMVIAGARNGKWGLLNVKGKFILQPQYDEIAIHNIEDRTFFVRIDDKWMKINIKGDVLEEFENNPTEVVIDIPAIRYNYD